MSEEYKTIEGFENFEVSTFGNVRSVKTGKMERQPIFKKYARVNLFNFLSKVETINKTFDVHRLVAITFLPNPENKPIVDHKDRDTLNNNLDNLRWATHSENGMNKSLLKSNTSTKAGVSYDKKSDKWRVRIAINGKEKHIGCYTNFDEAVQSRKEQEEIHYKEFRAI